MSSTATSSSATRDGQLSPFEQFRHGRQVIQAEGQVLLQLADRLDAEAFSRACRLLYECTGSAIVTGMGKAGLIGAKLAATLASTGTRAHFVHPGEAMHGDLGRIHSGDVVLVLSQSGETEETVRILPPLARIDAPIIALTAKPESTLGRAADVVLDLGPMQEACALGLAPSTSTAAMLALGDALALVVSRMHAFTPEDFARYHPGGSLGRKLSRVEQVMRPLDQCRVASAGTAVRDVLVLASRPGRRTGAVMLTDENGRLCGIFTDSDLARLFEARRDDALDRPAVRVMTAQPTTVRSGTMLSAAIEILAGRKISELPVVDEAHRPLGIIDITDVLDLLPREQAADSTEAFNSNEDSPPTVQFPDPTSEPNPPGCA